LVFDEPKSTTFVFELKIQPFEIFFDI